MNNAKIKLAEDLRKWVKEKWVDIGAPKKGGGYKPCGRSKGEKRKGYPKCVPAAKAARMSKGQKKSAVKRKRAAGNPGGKPTMVSTFKSKKESVQTFGQILSEKLCAKGKAAAKRKYDVYPSAYANMYASAVCSGKVKPGGKKKKKKKKVSEALTPAQIKAMKADLEKHRAERKRRGLGPYQGSGARGPTPLPKEARLRGGSSDSAEAAQQRADQDIENTGRTPAPGSRRRK